MVEEKNIQSNDCGTQYVYDFVPDVITKLVGDGVSELLQKSYVMYFDETNNVRKVAVKLKDDRLQLNIADIAQHFVLGGVALTKPEEPPTLEELKAIIGISPGQKMEEVKSRHIYEGDFRQVLSSQRLTNILDLFISRGWFIHFSSLNFLYFSIVDIVDSFVWNSPLKQYIFNPPFFYIIKDSFYRIFRRHMDENIQKLIDFEYPDVKNCRLPEFKKWIIEITQNYIKETGSKDPTIVFLLNLFNLSLKMGVDLVFVQDEDAGVYIKDLSSIYSTRIATFKESTLYLDKETHIEELIGSLVNRGNQLRENFSFIDSKSSVWIQLSDIIVGIIRRYLDFLDNDSKEILNQISTWDKVEIDNLKKLNRTISKSEAENILFLQHIDRLAIRENLGIVCAKYK